MTFISESACNGSVPNPFASVPFFNRDTLLACMMRKRNVVRYVLAPYGFGKSLLACSYARLVNEFRHTYWMDGSSPCFLRDLDASILLPDLLDETEVGDLVVFDDVPCLGATRRYTFWDVCRGLVQANREVIVCATPAANPLEGHESSCITLCAQDLLYSDKDLESIHALGMVQQMPSYSLSPTHRIPLLASGKNDAYFNFLQAHIDEASSATHIVLSFVMLLLERGTFDELEAILGFEVNEKTIDTTMLRPFISVDATTAEYAALGFPLQEVLHAFAPFMSNIALEIGLDNANELAGQLGEVLLNRKNANRAAKLLISLCDIPSRSAWLEQNQDKMLDMCFLVAAEHVYESLRSERWQAKPTLYTASRIRRMLIDHAEWAYEELVSISEKVDFPLSMRLLAVSYAYVLNDDAQQATEMEVSFYTQAASFANEAAELDNQMSHLWQFWSQAASGNVSIEDIARVLPLDSSAFLALACCVHKACMEAMDPSELHELTHKVQEVFHTSDEPTNNMALMLLRRQVDALGLILDMSEIPVLAAYRKIDLFEDSLEIQRSEYARSKAAKIGAFSTALQAQAARTSLREADIHSAIPFLNVRLFGSFEVLVGDTPVDQADFKRQKVRTLLALLVLESGHDLSCDNLAMRLWPESSIVQGRHSLNNAICLLRKGISLHDETCPYFHRSKGIVRLDRHLVKSDVAIAKELCTRLRYSEPEAEMYYHLLEQTRDVYRGILMPAENDEPMIISAREEWRNRMVNALLHAARRLAALDESSVSLQLVEFALSCNPQREDCYEQLMSLQAKFGQRPAAIDTWMRYRSFLYDELGLDPSQRVSELYERIINEDTRLSF